MNKHDFYSWGFDRVREQYRLFGTEYRELDSELHNLMKDLNEEQMNRVCDTLIDKGIRPNLTDNSLIVVVVNEEKR